MRLNIVYTNNGALNLFIVIYLYLTNSCIKLPNSNILSCVSPGFFSFWHANIIIIARRCFGGKSFF